jgi:4-aminobutyrate aminotransferase-like enzyme
MIKHHIAYNNFIDYRFRISKAKGSYLWNGEGKRYIDFASGWNVTNLGWNHPEVNEALARQAAINVYVPMETSDPVQEAYAASLTAALPPEIDTICRATGGTEAVEMSIKLARAATGRRKIIGFKKSYHGQLFASMALGWPADNVKQISPLVPEFIQVDFPNTYHTDATPEHRLTSFLADLEELLAHEDVAAIVSEAGIITGWGSTFVAPPGYLTKLRELTSKYGTLLILDEVGTGFSRTGRLFGYQHENVTPDLFVFAKGLTNGAAAMGAVAGSSKLIGPALDGTNLTSTFGWTVAACAVSAKVLEIHQRDHVWEQARVKGEHMMKRLRTELADHPHVGDVRGLGLEIGIEFVSDKQTKTGDEDFCRRVMSSALEAGLYVDGGDAVIQLMPPLVMPEDVLDEGISLLVSAINGPRGERQPNK